MKIIYATMFDNETKEKYGYSVDSKMKSLNELIAIIGGDFIKKTPRMVIYPGVVFSDFPFELETSNYEA